MLLQKKICLLGSYSVGKTSLVRRFVESIFTDIYHSTIGVKIEKKVVRTGNEQVDLVIWDIHGEDILQKVQVSYLRGISGYLLVVDGTRRQTLEDALTLNERITATVSNVPVLLVINKVDLIDQWEIDLDRQAQLAEKGWEIFRTSAKTGELVEEAFLRLTQAMLEKHGRKPNH
jgi:small GTP-binding protein